MRIISGKYKGSTIKAPSGHLTHPMSEKIRGAIFNALGDIEGLTLLDAFSGSGAISIEASSRGISKVIAVDVSKKAIDTILDNLKQLKISNIKPIRANVSTWSDINQESRFNLIVCDPPYDNVKLDIIAKLEKHLDKGGLLILSLPPETNYTTDLTLVFEKDYNDAKLYIYRNK